MCSVPHTMWFPLFLLSTCTGLIRVEGAPDLSKLPPGEPLGALRELVSRGSDGASLSGQLAVTETPALGTAAPTEPESVTETTDPLTEADPEPTAPSANGEVTPSESEPVSQSAAEESSTVAPQVTDGTESPDTEAPLPAETPQGAPSVTEPPAEESSDTEAPPATEPPQGTSSATEPPADEEAAPAQPTGPPPTEADQTATEQVSSAADDGAVTGPAPVDSEPATDTTPSPVLTPLTPPVTAPPAGPQTEAAGRSDRVPEAGGHEQSERIQLTAEDGDVMKEAEKDGDPAMEEAAKDGDSVMEEAVKIGDPAMEEAAKDGDPAMEEAAKDEDPAMEEAAKDGDPAMEEAAKDGDPAMEEAPKEPMDMDGGEAAGEQVDLDDIYHQGVSSHIGKSPVLTKRVQSSMTEMFLKPRQVAYQLGRHTVSTQVTKLEVTGIDKMRILEISSDVDEMSLNVTFQFPEITFTGTFNATGSILNRKQRGVLVLRTPFPSYGNGSIRAVIANTTAVSQAELAHSFNDRKLAIELLTSHVTFGEPDVRLLNVHLPRALRKLHFERLFRVAVAKTITHQLAAEVEPKLDQSLHDVITGVLDRVELNADGSGDFIKLGTDLKAWSTPPPAQTE